MKRPNDQRAPPQVPCHLAGLSVAAGKMVLQGLGCWQEGQVTQTKGKMIDDSTLNGATGIGLIALRAGQMKQVWHERHIDPGIDGTIELRDPSTGEMTDQHIFVQSKAYARFAGETHEGFHFTCDPRDLDYWLKASSPVIVVCSHPDTEEAWWAHVQSWFAEPARRASRRIDIDKATQKFDASAVEAMFAIADPHAKAHTPGPVDKKETLVSNLLPVEFPPLYYTAPVPTGLRVRDVYAKQRETGYEVRSDFFLSHGRIYTWAPIAGTALAGVADTDANQTPVGELIGGGPDAQRLFVRLLNAGLQHDLRDVTRWSADRKLLYYRATEDLSERQVRSASGRKRLAFKGYSQRKDTPTRKGYYRHAGLRWQFIEIDGAWFCELNPDYFFTSDGYKESPFADGRLAKMKRIDRHRAVLGETELWAGLLRGDWAEDEGNLLGATHDRLLTFDDLVTFAVDRGINDKAWKTPTGGENDADQLPFDFGEDEE